MHVHCNINFRCSLWLFRHALVSINWHRPWYLLAMHIPFEDIRVSLSRCHDTCMLSQIIPIWYMTTRRNGGCWCQAEKACWSRRCHGWTRGHSCRSAEWKNNAFGFTLLSFVFRIYVCISTYLKLVRWLSNQGLVPALRHTFARPFLCFFLINWWLVWSCYLPLLCNFQIISSVI